MVRYRSKLPSPLHTDYDLPIQIDEKEYEKVAQVDHGLAHVLLDYAAIMDLRRIVHAHVTGRQAIQLVAAPDKHRHIEHEQPVVAGYEYGYGQECMGHQLRYYPKVEIRTALLGIQVVTLQVGQGNGLLIK